MLLCHFARISYSSPPALTILPFFFFFFNAPATTEIYTLSLHDALPIFGEGGARAGHLAGRAALRRAFPQPALRARLPLAKGRRDRKSTRLNSSHPSISYAVFCLKKKKKKNSNTHTITHQNDMIVVRLT